MTQKALDSEFAPNNAQIAAAKAAGYVAWFGYFKFGNDGVANGWLDSDFQRVLAGGLQTMAYCSGWADPSSVKTRGQAVGIKTCLDDESGMRADGLWVQNWLSVSGSGLYGNYWVFPGRTAPFYILAGYPTSGDPYNASWNTSYIARPAGLCGWQWSGSHPEFGITVDSTWLDDGFFAFGPGGGSLDMALADQILAAVTMPLPPVPARLASYTDAQLNEVIANSTWDSITAVYGPEAEAWLYQKAHPGTIAQAFVAMKLELDALKAQVDALKTGSPVDLSGFQAAQAAIKAQVDAIKAEEDAVKAAVDSIKNKVDKDLA